MASFIPVVTTAAIPATAVATPALTRPPRAMPSAPNPEDSPIMPLCSIEPKPLVSGETPMLTEPADKDIRFSSGDDEGPHGGGPSGDNGSHQIRCDPFFLLQALCDGLT